MATKFTFNDRLLQEKLPSIFELFAVESMSSSTRPALKYLIKAIATSFSPGLLLITDEVALLIEAIIQGVTLYAYDASIAEKVYDLQRRVINSSGDPLKHLDRLKSFAVILLIPYLKSKLDAIHEVLQDEDDQLPVTFRKKHYFKYIFFKLYPFTLMLINIVKLIFQLLYLCKVTHIHSPALFLLGIILLRDTSANQDNTTHFGILQDIFSHAFPVILFALKFAQWWYSPEKEDMTTRITLLPIPPPPPPVKPLNGIPENPFLCPVCLKTRRNPVCIASSGFVYCYSCIYQKLAERPECPVSLIPANHSQLIRLYPQHLQLQLS